MRILILEDDQIKMGQIYSFIAEVYVDVDVDTAQSFTSGLDRIFSKEYDLILLDMSMPTFDVDGYESSGDFRHFAGKEILRKMKRKSIDTPVIIVTQFDKFGEKDDQIDLANLCSELEEKYDDIYFGTVSYSAAFSNWQDDLKAAIDKLIGEYDG